MLSQICILSVRLTYNIVGVSKETAFFDKSYEACKVFFARRRFEKLGA